MMSNPPDDLLPVLTREPPVPDAPGSWVRRLSAAVLPRAVRLGLLAAVALLLYVSAPQPPVPDDVSLESARQFFPTAARLVSGDAPLGGQKVLDESGTTLGLFLTTSPYADDLVGYSGPSNLLIALGPDQRIFGVHLLSSGDTPSHLDEIRTDASFWQQFIGRKPDSAPEKVEAVSGSTLTSLVFAEAIERRLRGSSTSLRFPEPVELSEVRQLFEGAASFETDDPRAGWNQVRDGEGQLLGYVVRTSPHSDNARGYQGPTESLVAVAADGKTVLDVRLRKSYDTEDYVDRVRESDEFRAMLAGRMVDEWAKIDFAQEGIEGVSGATQTSFGVADGVRRRFAADTTAAEQTAQPWNFHLGLLAVICGALVLTFSPLKSNRRVRIVWQAILILVFAIWLGDLLSMALFAGWARHGIPWQTAPTAILLAVVALLIPWTNRRQIYCQHICPHGAAQAWLGRFKRLHLRVSPQWQRRLGYFPAILLAISVVLAMFVHNFDLAVIEPFDGWVLKGAALTSAIIALIGLAASVFVPFAYCRYGCPTGELLRFMGSGGGRDRLRRRDLLAGMLVLAVTVALYGPQLWTTYAQSKTADSSPLERQSSKIDGKAFGTTWSVKIRGDHDLAPLKQAIDAELERIESTLSHWRADSSTAQFNASETTFETEQPEELLNLVSRANELSKLTQGRYDITVAPLVDAWGHGPNRTQTTPSEEQLAELKQRVGWEKLIVDREAKTLRKTHPQLHIDLGSLLQGYAADRVKSILDDAGVEEYLIDIGGELLARGSWTVAIEDPRNPSTPLRTFTLKDAALATSGLYRSNHLISPHSGRPVETTTTLCAVSAPTAIEADAWATALLAIGLPEATTLADQQGLAVLLFDQVLGERTNAAGVKVFGPTK